MVPIQSVNSGHGAIGFPLLSQTEQALPDACGAHWYALHVQSRLAGLAFKTLYQKGYEAFLPSYVSRRRWSDRIKLVEAPLFPGYLFCRFNIHEPLPVLTTPGVIRIAGAGKIPTMIEDDEISAVRRILRSGLAAQTWPFLNLGSRVYIGSGPLTGLEGILINNTDKIDRLVVSVTLLQRSVAVEIDRKWVVPASVYEGRDKGRYPGR
jgi:transcription termination/antitermination protein NusG